ncbi:hypothetical protein M3Y94_00240100 [Aphelenchoides besseyi]|nr:hypothetical protein M3Y94_00240100 [Aphelenchoides besseyi]
MSLESRVENFFKGLVSQQRSRSRSTTKQEAPKEKTANGSEERKAQGSIRKVKATARTSSRSLRHVDDFPKLADDAPLLFDPRRSGRQTKKPTDGFESPVPPWGDRFKQFRRSLKGRSLSSSKRISPKPPSSPPLNSKEEKPLKTNYSAYSEGDGLVFHGSPRISKRRSKSTSRTVEATPVTAILSSSNESTDTVIEKTHPLTLHGEIAVRAAAEGAKRQSRRDSTAKPPRPETESPYLSQIAVKTKEENTTQSPKINQLTAAAKRRQFFRRSRSVATQSSMDSRRSNSGATSTADFTPLPPPLVTHFPVDDSAPITEPQNGQFDAYGGFIPSTNNWQTESRPATQSAVYRVQLPFGRHRLRLEPSTCNHRPLKCHLKHEQVRESARFFRRHARSPSFGPTSSAAQRHRSTSGARGTIFERGPGSPRLGEKAVGAQSVMLRNRRLPAAKSESNLRRYAQSNNISWALDALRERVEETKYVTAVFESAKDGIAPILPDILKELKHWLGPSSRLLAVACEVHYSVPENVRSRAVEIRMKDELHRVLRQNNRRVLQLYDEQPGSFPLELIESKTEENCIARSLVFVHQLIVAGSRDSTLDAFQGIYRRYYPELLELQDATTVSSHKSYWTLDTLANDQRALLRPTPARFLFRPNRAVLAKKKCCCIEHGRSQNVRGHQ